jgi:hypothetical protein
MGIKLGLIFLDLLCLWVMGVDLVVDLAVDLCLWRWLAMDCVGWVFDLRWLNGCGGVLVGLWWPVMGLCWVYGGYLLILWWFLLGL